MFSEEEYVESILKEFGKVVDDFRNINGFQNDSMIRLMEDKIKQLQKKLNQKFRVTAFIVGWWCSNKVLHSLFSKPPSLN